MKTHHLRFFFGRSYADEALFSRAEVHGDDLLSGAILAGETEIGQVTNGVASFVEGRYNWPPEEIEKLRASGWISLNWSAEIRHAATGAHRKAQCDELAALDGPKSFRTFVGGLCANCKRRDSVKPADKERDLLA
jgi:hypothetical protein